MTRILNNNKLLGHLFFLILGIFAVVFYLERTTFVDPAWVVFKLTLEKTFQQEVGRYAAVIPQLLPLAGIWLGMPLKVILLLYSLSFIILYYAIFNVIAYLLKNDTMALAVPLVLVMGMSDSFYWISTETHQTLVYNILFFAFLYYPWKQSPGFFNSLKKQALASIIILLCFFTHPVSLFTVLFILGYYAIDTRSWKSPSVYILAILTIALAFLKLSLAPSDGYESSFFNSFFNFFENVLNLRESYSFKFFITHINLYIFPVLVSALITLSYIIRKQYLHLAYFIVATCIFMIIVFTTFNIYFHPHIQEKNIMPLNVFLLIPFFKDVSFSSQRWKLSRQLLIIILFIISMIHISMAGAAYSRRIGYVTELIEKVRALPETKFVINENLLNPDHFKVYWGMPFESMILSALNNPDSARTIYVLYNHEVLDRSVDLNNPNLLLTIQGYPFFLYKEYIDTNYFNLGNSVYRVLDEKDISSPNENRIIYLNRFNDPAFVEGGDSCRMDSSGTSYFMLRSEFSPGISTTYGTISAHSSAWIKVSVLVDPVNSLEPKALSLVITHEKEGVMMDYFTSYYDGMPALKPGLWNEISVTGMIRNAKKDDVVKVYLWNPGRNMVRMDEMMVTVNK